MVIWCMVFYGLVPMIAKSQSGNINPNSIQIDTNANLYPKHPANNTETPCTATALDTTILNSGATADWVKDCLANTDTDPDTTDSIAVGLTPNVTSATGGTGHWEGVRVIDAVAQADQDIFLTGGKENDLTTWNVGPGSVGSSKYDITQAYIANNQSFIFFGMERRGNNGTTAFDFEFNQNAPANSGTYLPTRTIGDVLLTFEMQGAGNSGSATPHVFIWDGTTYVEQNLNSLPAGLVTSINDTTVPPAPWGYVDSKGNWVLTPNIDRFQFAEAQVPLSILPGVNGCGGAAYVQVRTRSSATATSDLKDTTKIFKYLFGGPTAAGLLTALCDLQIGYDGSSSTDSSGKTVAQGGNITSFSWQFQKLTGSDPTSDSSWTNQGSPVTGISGTFTASSAGTYRAKLTITEGGAAACTNTITTNSATVVSTITATAALANDCSGNFTYGATPSGGVGSYTYVWQILKLNTTTNVYDDVTSTLLTATQKAAQSGSITNFADGTYKATVTVSNSSGLSCPITANAPGPLAVRNALTSSASKDANPATSGTGADSGFIAGLTATSNALVEDNPSYQWQQTNNFANPSWGNITGATGLTLSRSLSNIFTDGTIDSVSSFSLSSDAYSYRRASLGLRLHVERTLQGQSSPCTANSPLVTIRALKAIDP
jgi:hypothetical protein